MHEAVVQYFKGTTCGFKCHICSLKRYPDYVHHICELCLSINSRWPPPPKDPPPPEKDPDLTYPGDIDPDFKPARGDTLVVNPLIGSSSRKLGFKGSCCITYDGSPNFQFLKGDVLVRIGTYEIQIGGPPPKVEERKGQGKKPPAKPPPAKKDEKVDQKAGAKGAKDANGGAQVTGPVPEPEKRKDLVTYKPYEKVEVYFHDGDNMWRFMGLQTNLEMKNKVLLETQCPGLTAFYRYYKASTRVQAHTLAPLLGEIVLPEWLWQEDFDHKANNWRSGARWYRPDIPDREKLRPGTILLRPLVGRMRGDGLTLLNCVEMERAKRLEEQKAKELADQQAMERYLAMEAANAAPVVELKEEKGGEKGKGGKKEEPKKNPKKDEKDATKTDTKKDEKDPKKTDVKDDKKKGGKKVGKEEEKVAEPVPPVPNNDEFLKFPKWGAVEMYRFEGEEEAIGWVYWGRSNRICDTAYPAPLETAKPKFVHVDDRGFVQPVVEEPPPPEPVVDTKDKKGNKGKGDDKKGDKRGPAGDGKKKKGTT